MPLGARTIAATLVAIFALGVTGSTPRAAAQNHALNDVQNGAQADVRNAVPEADDLLEQLIGREVTVQLRFDVLGQTLPRHAQPTLIGMREAGITIIGDLTAYDDRWLVLNVDSKRWWIPREVILLMETEKE